MTHVILRRRQLGKTGVNKMADVASSGITPVLYRSLTKDFRDSRNWKQRIQWPADVDIVFRWGCTSNIPGDPTIINKSTAIHAVADKVGFRKTVASLQPHFPVWTEESELVYPCVVRPKVHHQGRSLFVVHNAQELHAAQQDWRIKKRGWYAAPLVNKTAEYRVFVVSGRAVCVAKKTPADPTVVAWNVAQGGSFANVRFDDWPLKAVRVSIEAFLTSGLDFGGVDVMVDSEGEVYILEINSAPSLTSPYRVKCFAKAFDYIVENGADVIPLQKEKGNYKKFIHPAILEQGGDGGEQ